jgi:hypothetical protein
MIKNRGKPDSGMQTIHKHQIQKFCHFKPKNDKARKWSEPTSGLYGWYQTKPFFAVKEGVVLAAGSKRLLP